MTANVALKKLIADVVALVPPASINSPAGPRQMDAVQQKLGVRFPEDVLAFYSVGDGFEEPTDFDHGGIQLWRLSAWQPVSQVCSASPSFEREPIVFADHGLSAWWYALDFEHASGDQVPVVFVGGNRAPFQVFDSFSSFLQGMLADDAFLYGGPAA